MDLLEAPETREAEAAGDHARPGQRDGERHPPHRSLRVQRTDAAALGISMPMVSSLARAHFPALTTAPPGRPEVEGRRSASTAAAFSLTKRTPGRITGQFQVRIEDLALMPTMEADLRTAISAAMADNWTTRSSPDPGPVRI